MKIINAKINVNNIDRDKLYKGKKGLYLNVVLIPTPNSQYSDYMIKQQTTKDEPDIILGNASEFIPGPEQSKPDVDSLGNKDKDDLPF